MGAAGGAGEDGLLIWNEFVYDCSGDVRTTIAYWPETTEPGTDMSARVLEPEQSRVPSVATYRTAVEGPLTRSTLTALESLPIDAQLPSHPTKLGTSVVQTVPSVGLLILSMSAVAKVARVAMVMVNAAVDFMVPFFKKNIGL